MTPEEEGSRLLSIATVIIIGVIGLILIGGYYLLKAIL